jgi:dienelactone hydrolase
MVVLSSSAGVCDVRERRYARLLAARGVAAFVVDSFGPRGIKNTMADQSRFKDEDMEADAFAAFDRLKDDPRIDPGAIAVMGVSKGGHCALATALVAHRRRHGRTAPDFAAHICIVPPCHIQMRNPLATNRPILFLLGGMDDYTGNAQATEYARRLQATGADVTTLTYPKAHHAWERPGQPLWLPDAENYSDCLFWEEDNGDLVHATTGETLTPSDLLRRRREFCHMGAHIGGGGETLARRTIRDILAFLEGHGAFPPGRATTGTTDDGGDHADG